MVSDSLSGAVWKKSSHSVNNGECVELAFLPDGTIGLRDSKDPLGPVLRFTRGEVDAFMKGVAGGEFDAYR
jgi:hypothetical protein